MYQTLSFLSSSSSSYTITSTNSISSSLPRRHHHHDRVIKAVATESPRRKGNNSESLYEVLRVNYKATANEIKTAYRSLAKIYHPDMQVVEDGRDFIKIRDAYATLSDPVERENYDSRIGVGMVVDSYTLTLRYRARTATSFTRTWETDQCW
ncbi:hypothetical protein ACFE04_024297 [Oxalis oulophora]